MPFLPNYKEALRSEFAHAVRFLGSAQKSVANGARSWPGYPEPLMAFRLTDSDIRSCQEHLGVRNNPTGLAPLGQALARLILPAADKVLIGQMLELLSGYALHSTPVTVRKFRSHSPIEEFGEHLRKRGYATELEMSMLELAELGYERYLLNNKLCRNRPTAA